MHANRRRTRLAAACVPLVSTRRERRHCGESLRAESRGKPRLAAHPERSVRRRTSVAHSAQGGPLVGWGLTVRSGPMHPVGGSATRCSVASLLRYQWKAYP